MSSESHVEPYYEDEDLDPTTDEMVNLLSQKYVVSSSDILT